MRRLATLALAGGILLGGCASLPSQKGRIASSALAAGHDTRIGKAVAPLLAANPGLSGVYALVSGRDAFAARVTMADAAERSLDVQYYIWRDDTTGALLFDALHAAARRGVRVRLLLDDNNSGGLDSRLALLDAHPNLEVRLFNPFAMRGARLFGFLTDFSRLNRRMHNKSFTVDGYATIVGGRNIGDEYFDATGDVLFADLDVLAVGPAVEAVSEDFDRYWNSPSAYPLRPLLGAPAEIQAKAVAPAGLAYMQAIRDSTIVKELKGKTLALEWAPVTLVSDDPSRVLGKETPGTGVADRLPQLLGAPRAQFDLVSPYFVPGPVWTARFGVLAQGGVKVRILTNSLEATDVAAVHSGYAKWRKPLLQAGVTLLELKRSGPRPAGARGSGPGGSSGSSLHAKTFAVDQARLFVGSFNFDYRSADLNTEMGFVIDSPALAGRVSTVLDTDVLERAYEVKLTPEGKLYWIERSAGMTLRHDVEPGTSWWRRGAVGFMSLLPIDWLL